MKKTFALSAPGKENQRLVEAVKNDVRKYVKRERRKSLPEGVDFWDFDCRVGPDKSEPASKHLAEVTGAIDAIAAGGGTAVYVEIISKPGRRTKKPVEITPGTPGSEPLSGESENVSPPDEPPTASAESVD